MKPILLYLLQVICCSGLLYGYYHLLLRNKKFHLYNRYYLLAAAVLSMLVPFLNIPVYFSGANTRPVWLQNISDISAASYIFTVPVQHTASTLFTWNNILVSLYILIAVFVSWRFISAVLSIRRIIGKYKVEKLDAVYFINTEEKGTPFSFFRWLFWNKKIQLDSPEGQQILRHELFHIKQKHSVDIIFIEMLTAIFWINPFFHLIKKELTTIHEFLADQSAVNENEKWNYAELLLAHLLGSPTLRLTHPFFHNQIKRRIAMITSSQKPKYQYFRKVLILPLLVVVAALFAFSYKQKLNDKEKQPTAVGAIAEKPGIIKVTLTDTSPRMRELKIVKDEEAEIKATKIKLDASTSGEGKSPLYVLNNVIVPKGKEVDVLKSIVPDHIQSINVLKDKSAVDKYGPDGADGVIEITTKTIKEVLLKEVQVKEVPADQFSEVVVVGYASPKTKVEPSFPGGQKEWGKYLERNLNPNVPLDNGAPAGTYTVWAQFVVAPDGYISDIKTLTEHGFGMEEEVTRILKAGPKWLPGTVNGKAISSYKKQPVTFMIVEEESSTTQKEAPVLNEVVVTGYSKQIPLSETDLAKLNPIYPNPASNSITIPYNTDIAGTGEIRVQDLTGKVYLLEKTTLVKGLNNLKVAVASLTSGMYIITVTDAGKNPSRIYKMLKDDKGKFN
jgi:TonB-dependent SusC/RagA subfamily outer membrane receptor